MYSFGTSNEKRKRSTFQLEMKSYPEITQIQVQRQTNSKTNGEKC